MLLYLVRHAAVDLDSDRAAPEWQLSDEGRRAAADLGRRQEWRELALAASSPEPKARDTAAPIAAAAGLNLRIEDDLREVDRRETPVVGAGEYGAMVASHFASPDESVNGWEPGTAARARVVACIDRLVAEADGPLAVVSHGLVLSHYVAHLRGRPAPDLAEWSRIPLPAVAVVRDGVPEPFA